MTTFPDKKITFLTILVVSFMCIVHSPAYCLTLEEENQVREYINTGNRLLAARRYQEAIDKYNQALEVDPTNHIAKGNIALVHNNWGTDYFNQRKYLEAKKQWQTAVDLNPNDSIARRNLQVLEVHIRNDKRRALKEALKQRDAEEAMEDEIEDPPIKKNSTSNNDTKKSTEKNNKPKKSAVVILNSGKTTYSSDTKQESTDNSFDRNEEKKAEPAAQSDFDSQKSNTHDTSNIEILTPTTSVDTILQDSLQTLKDSYQDKNKKNIEADINKSEKENKNFKTVIEEPVKTKKESPKPEKNASETEPVKEEKAEKKSNKLTIKDQIRKLEMTVFGEKRDSMPIIKRLIQLEKDTLGKKQSGPVKERVQKLNDTYGF